MRSRFSFVYLPLSLHFCLCLFILPPSLSSSPLPTLLHSFANANLMNISALKITKLMFLSIKLAARKQQIINSSSNQQCTQQQQQQHLWSADNKVKRGQGQGEVQWQWQEDSGFYGLALLSTCTKYLNFASGATNRSPPPVLPRPPPPPTLRC